MIWSRYSLALLVLGGALAIRWLLSPSLESSSPTVLLVAGVGIVVLAFGYGPAIMVAILGYLLANFLFSDPRVSLRISSVTIVLDLLSYLISSGVIITLGKFLHDARHHEQDSSLQSDIDTITAHHLGKLVSEPMQTNQVLQDELEFEENIVATVRDPMLVLDDQLRVRSANRSFYSNFKVTESETLGRRLYDLGNGQWRIAALRTLLEKVLPHKSSFDDYEVTHQFESIGLRVMILNARRVLKEKGNSSFILLAIEDITERRRLENELQELNSRFTTLVKNVRDHSIFTVDLDGYITSWNQEAGRILGFTEAEALGQHFSIIFTPEDLNQGVPNHELEAARQFGRADDERWHIRKNGERFWALGVVTPTYDAAGAHTGYSKILRDMTDRKRAEDLLVTTLESITDGFARFDRQWRFVYVNKEAERINRLTRAEMLGKTLWEVFPHLIGTKLDAEFRRAMNERITVEFENFYEPFGQWYVLKCYPAAEGGLTTYIREITATKVAIDALRKSEARLRRVFESNVVGMIKWDLDRSLILDANEKFLQMTGYSREDLKTARLNFRELTPPEWTTKNEAGIQTIRNSGQADAYEKEYFRKDGSKVPIYIAGTRFDDSPNEGMSIIVDLSERKRIEAEIVRLAAESDRQKRLYETVLTNTPDFMYVFSLDHKVIYANEALIKMWGRGYEGAIGKTFLEIGYEPWHAEMHDREIDQVRATRRPIRGEVPFHGTLGRRQYDYIFVPVIGADGEVEAVAGTTRDVTERKEAEERLRQSEARLSGVFWQAPVFMCVLRGENHVFEMANDRYYALVGERNLIGQGIREALPEVVNQGYVELLDSVYKTGETYIGTGSEVILDNVGQRYLDFVYQALRNSDGSVSGILVVGVDVTARHQAEAALRASEERAAFVRRSSGVGFWYCDLPFDVLEWDDLVKFHFHLPADSVVSIETFYNCIHSEDREPTRLAIEKSISEHTAYNVEYRTVSSETGAIKWVRAIGRTFYAADGTPTRFDGVTLDISEHKRAEQEREELLFQLREADRQKDEFLATLAHELRNPLAPIRNALQIMKLYNGSLEENESLRDLMERQVTQMSHLIDDLMDLSRVSRGKIALQKRILDIADSIRDAVDISRPLIDSQRHRLSIELPKDIIYVSADPTRLAQVISNILNNAAKYTDPGGDIRLYLQREDHQVAIIIEDNGVGIPKGMLPKIFEMFTQVDRSLEKSQGGLGIGLSIVSRLVSMHNGSIVAESDGPGLGSRFIIRLPIMEGIAGPHSLEASKSSVRVTRRRVLVVDDNIDGACSLATMLQLMGSEVQIAHDGLQAISVAESFRPDVILMDIGMPQLNGYDACRRIREKDWASDIFIVAQTGWGNDDDKIKSYEAGFNLHMVKPIDPSSLQKVLDELNPRKELLASLKVLAVDDRRDAIYVMEKLLKAIGCNARTAGDGSSAVEIAKEFIPDVIFLDIEMPGMSGIEVARLIRHEEPLRNVILIAMTGHDTDDDRQRFRQAGFNAHLVKPADIRTIQKMLEVCRSSVSF